MTLPTVTIIGNLTDDPVLAFTPSGVARANFTVASNERRKDAKTGEWVDGDTTFLNCTVWRDLAEHVSESLRRGSPVILTGLLRQRTLEQQTVQGPKRHTYTNVDVQHIGPDLSRGPAKQTIVKRTTAQAADDPFGGDPWNADAAPF